MKVICFKGQGNTGKTTIIRERILNEFFQTEIYMNKENDFVISFLYKKIRIGICSYGDELSFVKRKIEKLKSRGCKIIICACRTKGELLEYISGLSKNINWIERNSNNKYFGEPEFQQFVQMLNKLIQG